MNLFDLEGCNAVVTGSSRGIGFSIASRLAQHGANVVISSRKEASCVKAANEINQTTGKISAVPIRADIGNRADVTSLFANASKVLGKINILICNAASSPHFGPFSDIDDTQFKKTLENNVLSNHWLIQDALPHMSSKNNCSIVLISSISAFRAYPFMGAYSVSKAAELQLTRSYAQELAERNIRVNAICPGVIDTDFAKGVLSDPSARKKFEDSTLLSRVGQPDEIAGAAVFFSSNASSFITGQFLVIDGGATII